LKQVAVELAKEHIAVLLGSVGQIWDEVLDLFAKEERIGFRVPNESFCLPRIPLNHYRSCGQRNAAYW